MREGTVNKYVWVNSFAVAQQVGIVYFNAYVNATTNYVVGWVTRAALDEPYTYSVFYVGADGQVHSLGVRGTWQHANWAVQGAIESAQPAIGFQVPAMVHYLRRAIGR
jgi:hypothetical protein